MIYEKFHFHIYKIKTGPRQQRVVNHADNACLLCIFFKL